MPRVFKRRYLPDDACDIDRLADELLKRGLVELYGEGLAHIPTFARHQHVNPREASSKLPAPEGDASARVDDAQGGREGSLEGNGEGKEGEGSSAHPLPQSWTPDQEDLAWAAAARPDLTPALLEAETERFRNHALANGRTAVRWGPNWRNWVQRAHAGRELSASAKGEAAVTRRPRFGRAMARAVARLPAGQVLARGRLGTAAGERPVARAARAPRRMAAAPVD